MKNFTFTVRRLLLIILVAAIMMGTIRFGYLCYQRKKVAEEWASFHRFQIDLLNSVRDEIIEDNSIIRGMTKEDAIVSYEDDLKRNIEKEKAYRKAASQPWFSFPPGLESNPYTPPFPGM